MACAHQEFKFTIWLPMGAISTLGLSFDEI